jgi:hypothetical protein
MNSVGKVQRLCGVVLAVVTGWLSILVMDVAADASPFPAAMTPRPTRFFQDQNAAGFPDQSWPHDLSPAPWDAGAPASGPVQLIVELTESPAGIVLGVARRTFLPESTAETLARLQAARIMASQDALVETLTSPPINASVVGRAQWALNAVIITVDASQTAHIAALPGVKNVQRAIIGQFTDPAAAPESAPLPGSGPNEGFGFPSSNSAAQ